MPVDAQEVEQPAGVTGAESSPQPKPQTAEESDQKPKDPEKASTAESEEEEPKPDKDNRAPFEWVKRLKTKNETLTASIEEFKKYGIESPEHAEFLQREAQRIELVEEQLASNPKAFEADLLKEYPDAHRQIVDTAVAREFTSDPEAFEKRLYELDAPAYSKIAANVLKRHLFTEAKAVRGDNPELADYLEGVALKYSGTAQEQRRETPKPAQKAEAPDNERQQFYDEQVALDVNSRLVEKINTVLTDRGVEFKNDRQKTAFVDSVLDKLTDTLYEDRVFVQELKRIDDPRNGLNKAQRKASADHRFKFATMNNRLLKTLTDEIDLRNLPTGRKALPVERKEINGAGKAPGAALGKSESDRIYDELHARGLRGSDLTAAHLAEKRKLRLGQ